jgi:predicted TIM-barrel fold metal-dependent hydrolase
VTLADVGKACEQVKWCVERGAKLILMPMGPYNGKAPAHPDHDPFWSIVNEAGLRVVFHVSEAIYMKDHMAVWGEPVQQSRIKQTAFVWMHGYSERPVIETLSSFIFWNFFERFPNVKLLSAENGAEWVPAMLSKMDKCRGIAKNGYWPGGQLKDRPSRIFAQHVGVVAYPEDDLRAIIDQVGSVDWIMMGSDYPHAEGVEQPRVFADEACKGLSAEDCRFNSGTGAPAQAGAPQVPAQMFVRVPALAGRDRRDANPTPAGLPAGAGPTGNRNCRACG